MEPSISEAKADFNNTNGRILNFSPYSTAYVATNEIGLRNTLKHIPDNAQRALTVAASGDHPMFTQLYGIENIDTFDVSWNAKLIMDIKITALALLKHKDYCDLLIHLNRSRSNAMSVKHMPEIVEKLPQFEQQYILEMDDYRLFGHGGIEEDILPTKSEYRKMRKLINKPYNFIWSDIRHLHTQLKGKYDFMHLSNIMDYIHCYNGDSTRILRQLAKHANPGCNICLVGLTKTPFYACKQFLDSFKASKNNKQSWTYYQLPYNNTYILHRER